MKLLCALLCVVLLFAVALHSSGARRRGIPDLAAIAVAAGAGARRFARDIRCATRGLEPDLTLPDLVLPGRPEKPAGPAGIRADAGGLHQGAGDRAARRAGPQACRSVPRPLAAIERQFGVPGNIVLAIFGRETDYGRSVDKRSAIRVLATQAYLGKRKEKFRKEFLLALKILDDRQIKLADMRSSWAGAMGLTQFLPSDYFKYAVDFDGDGRADIWNSVPDALGFGGQAARRQGLAARPALGLRGASAGQCRLHHRHSGQHAADRRMAQARLHAGLWPQGVAGGSRDRGFAAAARRALRPVVPGDQKIISSSRNTIFPISTCCLSAI